MNPLEFNGTELSATEFRDHLALRYGMDPILLPENVMDVMGDTQFTIHRNVKRRVDPSEAQ